MHHDYSLSTRRRKHSLGRPPIVWRSIFFDRMRQVIKNIIYSKLIDCILYMLQKASF